MVAARGALPPRERGSDVDDVTVAGVEENGVERGGGVLVEGCYKCSVRLS